MMKNSDDESVDDYDSGGDDDDSSIEPSRFSKPHLFC
jgi:hypothetical protein